MYRGATTRYWSWTIADSASRAWNTPAIINSKPAKKLMP